MNKDIKVVLIFFTVFISVISIIFCIIIKNNKYEVVLNDDEHIIYSIKGSDKLLIVPMNNRKEKPYILDIKDTIKRKQEEFIITKHEEIN